MCRIEKLAKLCQDKNVYIQTHNFPDPDAIASAFGLQKLLGIYGVEAKLCYAGRIDKLSTFKMLQLFNIEFYSYDSLKEQMKESDYIICVDSQKNSGNVTDFIGNEVAVIDHHPVFVEPNYLYEDLRITGACASIIAQYYHEAGLTPDSDTATALLYGIKIDTLQFSRGITSLDIDMFAFLHPLTDKVKMANLERNSMEFNDLRAYGAAIEGIKVYGTTGFSSIPFSCNDALIASISDFILSLEEVEVAIIFSYREDEIKFSVRSEIESVHAGKLINNVLKNYGSGGGHAAMAGGIIPNNNIPLLGPLVEERIIQLFTEEIDKITT